MGRVHLGARGVAGLMRDAIDESGLQVGEPPATAVAVKVRCPSRALNDEAAKFCAQCGQAQ